VTVTIYGQSFCFTGGPPVPEGSLRVFIERRWERRWFVGGANQLTVVSAPSSL